MLKIKSYQQKNTALLALTILGLLLIYIVNIRKTWTSYTTYRTMKAKVERASTAPADMANYRSQLVALQGSSQLPYNRERLLEEITAFCSEHDLLIRSFPDAQRIVEKGVPIVTNEIEVEGGYKEIVKLVYLIEQQKKLASVSAMTCFLHKDRETRKANLRGRIVLRNMD